MAETWRVVLRDGSVREVVVYRDDSPSRYSVSTHPWCAGGMRSRTPNGAVTSAMSLGDNPVAEILAPGEPTRAELVAQLATVTAERAAAEDIARQWIDGAAEANKTISDLHAQLAAALRRRGTLHDVATLRIRVESLEVALRDACEWVGTRDDFIPRVINVLRGANVADERAERATRERDDAHAQLAAVTRERDVFRAQQAPLLDAHDALVAAARAAGWTGAGATGAELVAWVRRGERERCDDVITARLVDAVREVREKTYRGTGAERDTAAAVRDAIEAVRDMIREGGE